jgi:hypothetical protein
MEADNRPIGVPAALAGRPSRAPRTYRPDELVRVEIRMPATVAADLFARARDAHQPVSRTASDLLAKALDDACGDAMV